VVVEGGVAGAPAGADDGLASADGLGLAVAAGARVAAGEAVGKTIVVGNGPKPAMAMATGASLADGERIAEGAPGSVARTIALGAGEGLASSGAPGRDSPP
jgi:hypothetical protein